MSSPNAFPSFSRAYHRYPPRTGKVLRGATAGAAATLFDMLTLANAANAIPTTELGLGQRTWLYFRVFGADAYLEWSAANTVVATAAASLFMVANEAQEWSASLTQGDRYMSIIRAAAIDVSWEAYLTDVRY